MIIGVEGISAAEIGLLRTILKLSTQLAVDWTLTEGGPCHVLLTTLAATPAHVPGAAKTQVVPVVRRGENPGGEFLERPFRAEDFVALLGRVGPAAKADAGQERQGEALPSPHAWRRGRLKRWPPTELLRGDPRRVRLATLLTKRHLDLAELQRLSGEPADRCQVFLQLSKSRGSTWSTSRLARPFQSRRRSGRCSRCRAP
jgi:hypothetical protein